MHTDHHKICLETLGYIRYLLLGGGGLTQLLPNEESFVPILGNQGVILLPDLLRLHVKGKIVFLISEDMGHQEEVSALLEEAAGDYLIGHVGLL
mmetsp:Transcript_42441/g.40689  ORF Transcript_42441/g.40689 Transcript_42441/m.40689 type:complete len:94 (-) Transcript_42441:48-329(-)